jgi:hypothetical protein
MTKDELRILGEEGAKAILERRNEKPSDFQIAFSLAAGALALAEDLTVPEMLAEDVFKKALAQHSVSDATFRSAVTDARKQIKAAKRQAEEEAAEASRPRVRRSLRPKAQGSARPQAPGHAPRSRPSEPLGTSFPADGISNHSTEGL